MFFEVFLFVFASHHISLAHQKRSKKPSKTHPTWCTLHIFRKEPCNYTVPFSDTKPVWRPTLTSPKLLAFPKPIYFGVCEGKYAWKGGLNVSPASPNSPAWTSPKTWAEQTKRAHGFKLPLMPLPPLSLWLC